MWLKLQKNMQNKDAIKKKVKKENNIYYKSQL